jgi:hypothetical protein
MQGRVTEQLPRFILAPVDTGPASSRTGTEPAPPAVAIPAAWPPNLGDPVTWPAQTGPLRWRVVAVDAERGQARISGRVLEMKQEHDVLLADLEAVPIVVKSRSSSTRPSPQRPPNPESQRDRSPPDERSRVERAVDRLEFSAECASTSASLRRTSLGARSAAGCDASCGTRGSSRGGSPNICGSGRAASRSWSRSVPPTSTPSWLSGWFRADAPDGTATPTTDSRAGGPVDASRGTRLKGVDPMPTTRLAQLDPIESGPKADPAGSPPFRHGPRSVPRNTKGPQKRAF